ncbi:MAG: sugar transferase [Ignavibacteria bacterium]|nr:sugar transferase [Ignavibacteria bacterium]
MFRDLYKLEGLDLKYGVKSKLSDLLDEEVYRFIDSNIELNNKTVILDTDSNFSIDIIQDRVDTIINFKQLNSINRINKYFEAVNKKLNDGGLLLGCVETYSQRRERILKKHHPVISYPYYFIDFIMKRVIPKLKLTRKIFYFLTNNKNRAISRVETFGRLYSCGFEIVSEKKIKNLLFFVVRKVTTPKYESEPTYGMLIKLRRIGKNGNEMEVRKLRTMYAFSEYLQGFVYQNNFLEIGGKFRNDYRVTTWGKFLRTFWIDELPMLLNWLKREVQLIGVRPLSRQYFEMYDEELKQIRTKYKPGLIPPYYADMPKLLPEIMESERRYFEAYEKNPLKTQWRYFWKVMYNIVVNKARSG